MGTSQITQPTYACTSVQVLQLLQLITMATESMAAASNGAPKAFMHKTLLAFVSTHAPCIAMLTI